MAIALTGSYWYGFKASEYAIEHGYLDYKTFASAFSHVLNNDIMSAATAKGFYFDLINGGDSEGFTDDIYQFYIVPEWAVNEIFTDTAEIVFYCEELDIYLWGVTHWGTAWDNVLTDIRINAGGEK